MAVSNIFGALGICFQSSLILGKEIACCLESVIIVCYKFKCGVFFPLADNKWGRRIQMLLI